MALKEQISKHLGVPFVEIMHEGERKYLCYNGVLFTDSEYGGYPDLQLEYERREKEDKLYDYAYAKSTGLLRKKRTKVLQQTSAKVSPQEVQLLYEEPSSSADSTDISERNKGVYGNETLQGSFLHPSRVHQGAEEQGHNNNVRRLCDSADKTEEEEKAFGLQFQNGNNRRAVIFIIALLTLTSLISGYISTLHTATYLFDYVDLLSAWLMSASVTAYNATAFEVAVIFKVNRRYALALLFMVLWGMVTVFSMSTTVSVFYDRFNFTEAQIAEDNKQLDSTKLALEVLRTKETDLREAITFKKQDIVYRQEKNYATTQLRLELEALQKELQNNLTEQQKLVYDVPEATQEVVQRKESLFSFLGRLMHLEGGILEFIISSLSAIFINIITPFSVIAVAEIRKTR